MEIQRRNRTIQPQDENAYGGKGKTNISLARGQGLTVRGVLDEVSGNIQIKRDLQPTKVALSAAEFEKKSLIARRNYSHVQSKVDTGLAPRIQPSSRPPLRREESTGGLATRAALITRAAAKDILKKDNEVKQSGASSQLKKLTKETKKPVAKINPFKEPKLKPILKDPAESLRNLKLVEPIDKITSIKEVETPTLPPNIEDVDAGDNSPFLMSVYIKDIYSYLTELELEFPVLENHLKNQGMITGQMRSTLINWLVEVQCQFSLLLETFQITVGIVDRYLQVVPNIHKDNLQLIGVTAMFIASKYEEIYAPDIGDFVYITDNAYTKSEIRRCERDIFKKLGFCLARPIPLSFLRRFVKASGGTSKNHHLAKYFVDLCLVETSMAHYRPSELAAAAICLSLHLLSSKSLDDVWTPTLSYYSGYSLSHIKPIIKKIAKLVTNVEKSRLQAVYNKYTGITLAKVSTLPQLKSEAIYELIESS